MIDYPRFPISELHLIKSRLCGISTLESQLQHWSMFKDNRSSSYNALDQRSWNSKVNWRTYDIAIDCRAKRFSPLRYAWCDDCVWLERLLDTHVRFRKRVSKSSVLKNTIGSYEEGKLFSWSTSISVQPDFMKQYKESQTDSIYVCSMTMSKISTFDGIKLYYQQAICLQMWSWKGCASQNYRTLFSFIPSWLLYDQETVRNNGQTSYLWLKTSVKLRIDQMMRTRNFRVRSEVVERRAVTKSHRGKTFHVERKVGEYF